MKKTTLCYMEKDNQYLMLHRIKKERDANKDKWIGIGGHFEEGETPEECVLREVKEETGLTLTSFRLRGLIDFVSDRWEREWMYLFTADEFAKEVPDHGRETSVPAEQEPVDGGGAVDGLPMTEPCDDLPDCDEGQLEWVDKDRIIELKLWEGDNIFLNLLDTRDEYFELKLVYEGEKLVEAVLDGEAMELFDICDDEGEPTGQTRERSVVHRYGTVHRTAHVWITRKNSEGTVDILLQKRSADKDSFPGCYDISSAGHIPAGCDWKESALRELAEELGIEAEPQDLEYAGKVRTQFKGAFHGQPFYNVEISAVYIYRKPVDESELALQNSEVESVRWMNLHACIRAVRENKMPNCLIPEELELLARYLGEIEERQNPELLIGKCGFYCGSCPTYVSGECAGCMEAHEAGDCYTRDCVLKRGLDYCGKCEGFPCDEIMTGEKVTVLDKNWLRWKRRLK